MTTMLSFGIQDIMMAVSSRKTGFFGTSLGFMLIQIAIYAVLAVFIFNWKISLQPVTIAMLIFCGLASAASLFGYNKGLEVGNISIVATIGGMWGAITAVLGFIFLGEKITYFQIFYILLIIIGTALVSLNLKDILKLGTYRLYKGTEYALMATFGWGMYFFVMSILSSKLGWFDAAFLVAISTVAFMSVYGFTTKAKTKIKRSSYTLLFLVALTSALGIFSYNLGVISNYTDIVAPISSASPLVTVALAAFFFKEKLSKNQMLGMALVLIGLIMLAI